MKALNTIVKILAALAAVAGAIYVIATYGDKIVAWAKKLWASLPQATEAEFVPGPVVKEAVQETAEETPVEEVPVQEVPAQEPAPQIPENEPVADEADFAE